ncbi:MAG: ATP-binding protein [Acidimicrobiales bacterium]
MAVALVSHRPAEEQRAEFPGGPASSRAARAWAGPLLRGWGLDGLVDDAELVLSELVANAATYGGGSVVVALRPVEGGVRIEVCDEAHSDVHVVRGAVDRPSGRGLLIVDALASRWGVDHDDDHKAVWAELRGRR